MSSASWLALSVFTILLLAAAYSDVITMRIPNAISVALVLCFLLDALVTGASIERTLLHLMSGALMLAAGFGLFASGLVGGGDVKLASGIATWVGISGSLDFMLTTAVFGGVLTIVLLIFRSIRLPVAAQGWGWLARLHHKGTGVPYGVALAAAGLILSPASPFL